MDILLLAIIAFFVVWKFRSILNQNQSFTKGNSNNMQGSHAVSKNIMLQNIKIMSNQKLQKKVQQNEINEIYEQEKGNLDESLHESYKELLSLNLSFVVKNLVSALQNTYEELLLSFETKKPSFTSVLVEKSLYLNLIKKIENISYSIYLLKINKTSIKEIEIKDRNIKIVAEISSQQLIYKEDDNGNVVEGSKVKYVPVTENIEIAYFPNSTLWTLNRIF